MGEARIIVVGGGFAGVTLAEQLSRHVAREVQVAVISSENHMVFTPMLAEVAGRSLSAFDVLVPGRQMAPRALWFTATVTGVDLKKNEVEFTRPDGKTETLSYTHLVLACGSAVNLDAVPGMAAHASPSGQPATAWSWATKSSHALSRRLWNPTQLNASGC
jgi:NADH:ubiquinone reductase (H+-translocating)